MLQRAAIFVEDEPGARDAIIEPELPHPAVIKDVVQCGGIAWEGMIRRHRQLLCPAVNASEMRIESTRARGHAAGRNPDAEQARHAPCGPGGIYQKTRSQIFRLACPLEFQHPTVSVRLDGRYSGVFQQRYSGFADCVGKKRIDIGSEPVCVADLCRSTRGDE